MASVSPRKSRLRLGVVGVGKMGRYYLEKFRCLPEAEPVGFFDTDRARAEEIQNSFGIVSFASLTELLFEVDAMVVASPTESHAAVTRQALESGVHVLVEKPIASNVADAEGMVQLAARKGLVLQVGMVERFRLAALAKETIFLPVRFIETHRLSPHLSREAGVDVVSDLMIHDLDLALSLTQEDPISVSAIGMRVITPQVDIANARLEFRDGSIIHLNASRVSAEPVRKLRIFSADTYLSFDLKQNSAVLFRRKEHNAVERVIHEAPGFDPLLEQTTDFLHCIRTGRRPVVNGQDGLRALRYADLVAKKIQEREVLFQKEPELSVDNTNASRRGNWHGTS